MFRIARNKNSKCPVEWEPKHKRILRMCGVRMAALYLRNRGYTPEQAVTLLFR